ncbi:tellurite resistance/C4-dicarboxylate transporter family protein [Streptomyces roseicoloratus]|uniref:Tellurite resistance/C4-dicarboxylate transporter family protein n=1 Tax=Streptomyces roseicoloratus TaxID=2508722 RepID=A0ABY9S283_9ACTN|nr:tellurite resistance/C4-dicarboxylate transporter family protein [Streptomyces roseicoloratus]WMX48547.1 tellurite resistance/C4-dicarboxylate transporter family protein [Streptomyces roseicoloratus]
MAPWWAVLPPVAGAAVMATGVLSIGLYLVGLEVVSLVAFGLAWALWLVLAGDVTALFLSDRRGWEAQADTPPALTAVAATCVLGVRCALLGWGPAGIVLLGIAAVAWVALLPVVLRHLGRRMPGGVFLICVATEALVVVAGTLAPRYGRGFAWAGLVLFALGLVLYGDALARFDFRQVVTGAGDQWVAGGALSLSALAGAKLAESGDVLGTGGVLRTVSLVLLGLSLVWYGVLLAGEAARPRLGYDVRRWATVFPMGMTAVACLAVATATEAGWPGPPGRVLLGIAAAAWLLTAYGLARRAAGARTSAQTSSGRPV